MTKMTTEERMGRQMNDFFLSLAKEMDEKELEEMIIAEKYLMKQHKRMAEQQIKEIQIKKNVVDKFSVVSGKLFYDGQECVKPL